MQKKKILILGIGNYLMGDEGLGVHVANRLRMEELPTGVDVVVGGVEGFHLLGYFEGYETVILVDATLDDHPIGTIRLIKPRFPQDLLKAMSIHNIGLNDRMSALQVLEKMPGIHLFVVTIENPQPKGIELTVEVEKVIPLLIKKIRKLVGEIQQEALEYEELYLQIY